MLSILIFINKHLSFILITLFKRWTIFSKHNTILVKSIRLLIWKFVEKTVLCLIKKHSAVLTVKNNDYGDFRAHKMLYCNAKHSPQTNVFQTYHLALPWELALHMLNTSVRTNNFFKTFKSFSPLLINKHLNCFCEISFLFAVFCSVFWEFLFLPKLFFWFL